MPRRRLSSDGLKLFNMAYTHPPSPSIIKKIFFCLFHTEYDDQLDKMVDQCRTASQQLYSYTQHKDIDTNKLINNSMFNIILSVLMDDGKIGNKHQIRRNLHYFIDVARKASEEHDHNTAVLIRAAIMHHSILQLKLKPRKQNDEFFETFEKKYGTWRNCYKEHLLHAMNNRNFTDFIPSLMVLNMHHERHKAYTTIGRCKLRYEPQEIKGRIGMHAIQYHYMGDKMPLYEQPTISNNTDLILIAQQAR